jgi:hypothetical protein
MSDHFEFAFNGSGISGPARAQRLSGSLKRDVALLNGPFSCNQPERYVGNDIKKEEHEFVQADERVEHHIEGFSGQRKPYAVQSVCPITGEYADQE